MNIGVLVRYTSLSVTEMCLHHPGRSICTYFRLQVRNFFHLGLDKTDLSETAEGGLQKERLWFRNCQNRTCQLRTAHRQHAVFCVPEFPMIAPHSAVAAGNKNSRHAY